MPIIKHGISENKSQIILQLIQVFLVGLTIGMTRTVIPGLADTEFGLGTQQFLLLTAFVVVFGVVKAVMNLLAGRLSDQYGRACTNCWMGCCNSSPIYDFSRTKLGLDYWCNLIIRCQSRVVLVNDN